MVPSGLLTPLIAPLADRGRRERALVLIAAVRGVATGAAGFVVGLGGRVWIVYALAAVSTVAATLYRPVHSALLIEAPNWSPGGSSLFVNGNGQLWRVELGGRPPELSPVSFTGLPPINNDHVLSPDGRQIYLSAMDGHIYRGAVGGGDVERVTSEERIWHFLHGVSPDGSRLAYVRLADLTEPGRLALMEPHGPSVVIDTGDGHLDGPEWSPDGVWIYFNTESFTSAPGHAQLARIRDGTGRMERLVASETVDWFPHLSPDGRFAAYIAFPPGTLGHPPNLNVEVRVVSTAAWSSPIQAYPLFGGQGTINVNSWSPDSGRFAFVAYPTA